MANATTSSMQEQTFTVTTSEFRQMLDAHDRRMAQIYEDRVDAQLGRLGLVNVTDRPSSTEPAPLPFPDVPNDTPAVRPVWIHGEPRTAPTVDEVHRQANIAAVQAGSPTPPALFHSAASSAKPVETPASTPAPAQTSNPRTNTPWRTVNMNAPQTQYPQYQAVPAPTQAPAPIQMQAPSPFAQGPVTLTSAPAAHGCEGAPAYRTVPTSAPTDTPVQAPAPTPKEHKYPRHDAHFGQLLANAGIPFSSVRVDLTKDGRTVVEVYADNATCKAAGIARKPDLFAWGRDLALVINGTDKGFRPYSPLAKEWFVNYAGVAVYIG